jgi:hypothetical protein
LIIRNDDTTKQPCPLESAGFRIGLQRLERVLQPWFEVSCHPTTNT